MLRDLSRILARDTRPVEPSPQDQIPRNPALDLPDVEDGPELDRPRLSMPLGDMYDDDSFHDAPPRRSLLPYLPDDVDNGTIQSLEFGRRALSEDPRMMYNTRLSERFGDLTELGIEEEEYEIDGTFINRRATLNPDQLLQEDIEDGLDDTTTEMRVLTGRQDGRQSDFNLGVFGEVDEEDEEPTFRFNIPQRIHAPIQEEPFEELQDRLQEDLQDENSDEEGNEEAGSGGNIDLEEEDPLPVDVDNDTRGFEIAGWESDHGAEDDTDLQAYREEVSAMDRSLHEKTPERSAAREQRPRKQRKEIKTSRIGLDYSSFHAGTVKRLANGFAKSHSKTKISKDTLAALVQTTDWFFEQMGEDLKAYADHAGRKVIEQSDVVAVMKRYVHFTFGVHSCTCRDYTGTDYSQLGRVRSRVIAPYFLWPRKCYQESCYKN
jgi:histone H3/H4